MLYLDTSALIKVYLDEAYSHEVKHLLDSRQSTLASTPLIYVELRAALAAALRNTRITDQALDTALQEFKSLWQDAVSVDLDDSLIQRAGDLAHFCGLRGYDAVHIASAERLKNAGLHGLRLLSFDKQLIHAAKILGITCIAF